MMNFREKADQLFDYFDKLNLEYPGRWEQELEVARRWRELVAKDDISPEEARRFREEVDDVVVTPCGSGWVELQVCIKLWTKHLEEDHSP